MALRKASPAFWDRLANEIEGDASSDLFTRGRYATDASMYQCFPAGVACPKTGSDVAIVLEMAREEGLSVVARGGGTSTAGQALGEGVVLDFTKYMRGIGAIDAENARCVVEPGCTPAALAAALEPHGLFLPVEIASAQSATIGGMLGNNASGLRALRYGSMRDRILSAMALIADGQRVHFRAIAEDETARFPGRERLLDLLQFGEAHEKDIARAFPLRAPGTPEPPGYDLRALLPYSEDQNLARLLAGSEGTLAIATSIELKLARLPGTRALGVCRFADLGGALRVIPKIALLNPTAIELLDRTLIDIVAARRDPHAARLLQGDPEALLIVEFDEENPVDNTRLLKGLSETLAEADKGRFPLVEIMGENNRAALWLLRHNAVTRAWRMKSAAQPLSFMEDGAVPLHRLAAYGAELEALLARHGVRSALYGSAGRGCLIVRPVLNLRHAHDRQRMRALSDEMAALIVRHGGVLSGGHGIGLARGEALERALAPDALRLFSDLKAQLDPGFVLNPGKILRPPDFDAAALLRAPREAKAADVPVALSWEAEATPARALEHARRCAGHALCRTAEQRFACPSFAVTHDERDSARGRAQTMRLALSGQLGDEALGSPAMLEAMALCVSCKACGSACPFGVDIPKMRVEALAAARAVGRFSRAQELYANLADYTERAARWRWFLAARDLLPGLARFTERKLGLAADRPWPRWAGRRFRAPAEAEPGPRGLVALFADTFNRSFETSNLRAAQSVLEAAGYGVVAFTDGEDGALCCGRCAYDAGDIDKARAQALRLSRAAAAYAARGVPVIGLEPNCVLMMRDEYAALGLPVADPPPVLLFEELLARRIGNQDLSLPLKAIEANVVLHSHCHERAHGVDAHAEAVLRLIPDLAITLAPPSCCGLNGLMGMTPDTLDASLAMAEQALFPAIRKAGRDALVSATGFSCRKQIQDGLGRPARHPAMLLDLALKGDAEIVG
ncbi:FAD-binding protein [Rhodomicrobium sp. Az07]|uniref:FAD-binding and (Fe-S)-binding domain-containing protein n=1 Tax=Rhodomicrobium sp. Az07 TaxID=2839034 RepID=UPI001BE76AC5|nr:FAD-binding and (Fe-S)-binding domain-containing protein [Rhodomicrobium sp. Az07]MBT3072099.1 FAD-binding protein [Rhodomicrobium sp. Az07]